jgi:hypothetical protein
VRREGRGTYGGEAERVDLDTERRNVLLLELSSQMALDEGRLGRVSNILWLIVAVLMGVEKSSVGRIARASHPSQGLQQKSAHSPFRYHRHRQARA